MTSRLQLLQDAGVAPWLDSLSQTALDETLPGLIANHGLTGVTSNTAILEKALASAEYDERIKARAADGLSAREIYAEIAIELVQAAADQLLPVYEATGGQDGYVSFEVDPDLAEDTDKTVEQAREYWSRVNRPNLMIKIPGTDAGIPAVERCLRAGLNVNVTLLFSVAQYRKVMEAYISAAKLRNDSDEPLKSHSVASFFVSRVDSAAEKQLPKDSPLRGHVGVANARAAYAAFVERFEQDDVRELFDAGMPVQRPLWASTGVKNPDYSDTLYVDSLIGAHSVNTMPLATIEAFIDHGTVTTNTISEPYEDVLRGLSEAGVDLDAVTEQLLAEGLEAFVTPMTSLLDTINERAAA